MSVKFKSEVNVKISKPLGLGQDYIHSDGMGAELSGGYLEIYNTPVRREYQDHNVHMKEYSALRNRAVILPLDKESIKMLGEYFIRLAEDENTFNQPYDY